MGRRKEHDRQRHNALACSAPAMPIGKSGYRALNRANGGPEKPVNAHLFSRPSLLEKESSFFGFFELFAVKTSCPNFPLARSIANDQSTLMGTFVTTMFVG